MVSSGLSGQNDDHTTRWSGTASDTAGRTSPGCNLNQASSSVVSAA